MRKTSDLTALQQCLEVKKRLGLKDIVDLDQLVTVSDLVQQIEIDVKEEELNVLKRLVKILENN